MTEPRGNPELPQWDLSPEERVGFERMKQAMLTTYPEVAEWFEGHKRAEIIYSFGYVDGQIAVYRESRGWARD